MKVWVSHIIYIIIAIVIIIITIIIYTMIVENHKVNNFVTNKINKLPFFDIIEFRNKYPNLQTSYNNLSSTLPIYIFYHVGINGKSTNYENLINDQLNEIFYSGLYEKCDTIYYGCNGKYSDVILKDFFAPYNKIKSLEGAIAPNEKTYENKTVNAMIKFSKDAKQSFYGLYMHTKGMTHSKRSNGQWRKHMEYWLIKKHLLCIDILNRGFNTVGTGLLHTHSIWTSNGIKNVFLKNKWKQSYNGNFYWFTSNFLKKCDFSKNAPFFEKKLQFKIRLTEIITTSRSSTLLLVHEHLTLRFCSLFSLFFLF